MTIQVGLTHRTSYRFDKPVGLSPHEIRLRPAPHCRTPIKSYSLKVVPEKHFLNWQQDPFGNWVARVVFPDKSAELSVTVDLVAEMTVINPFDFFVEKYAETFPFGYPAGLHTELLPFLEKEVPGPRLSTWLEAFGRELRPGMAIVDMLVAVNTHLQRDISYIVRMEPGVQSCEDTLGLRKGSCRDSAWLMVQVMRHLGLAARFASGYLIQLTADVKALDGPSGTDRDFTDLHAWTEVYIPGAGWVGLDPTSGLFAGEGHIPLACTAIPSSAAPITGFTDVAQVEFGFHMEVKRLHEDPRVTRPYTPAQWEDIDRLGRKVDEQLAAWDVRLTMGGEPTFVSIDDMEGPEWNVAALGERKWRLAGELFLRMRDRFAPGGLLHHGQGKWYPGEPLPRWALTCFWRTDGKPLWTNAALLADEGRDHGHDSADAERFASALAARLGLHPDHVIAAYEDVWQAVQTEQRVPVNVDPLNVDLADSFARKGLAGMLARGLGKPAGYVVPLKAAARPRNDDDAAWLSSPWPLPREHLYLTGGDSPMGFRLPLDTLPWIAPADREPRHEPDPFEARASLQAPGGAGVVARARKPKAMKLDVGQSGIEVIHTALCVQARAGRLHLFFPPLETVEDWIDLVAAVEATASQFGLPVVLEGYTPPFDTRLKRFAVTPDPGVIEVNIHPASSWAELAGNTETLYEEARATRLGTEKFMLDGRHTGTGGGNHVTIGGITPSDSPLLRRPDLLKSLITYWQNHPALSYLFSGMFIGPTSQAPRVDEARDDALYELEIAFQQLAKNARVGEEVPQPWLADRLLRNLLVDLTGNTHRAEFSIDKLYSPDGPTGRLGLLEFRAFEMPPHWQMSLTQMLLLRSLIARFWKTPYNGRLVRWGTSLHDRFMLPHFIAEDLKSVVGDLRESGYGLAMEWFAPFLEFRFPRYGVLDAGGVQLELRQALEPWHVLGEEAAAGGAARYVDSSVERVQVKLNNMTDGRHVVLCNGRMLPLTATGTQGEFVAGVRYKAWQPSSALHPTIGAQAPLVFDLFDTWNGRAVAGCTYHASHPGGRNYDRFPVNANEAEARRMARFVAHGHTAGTLAFQPEAPSRDFPLTLDLRRQPDTAVGFPPVQAGQQQQQ